MEKGKKVIIYDTTLRDGNQAQGINFSIQDKIKIAKKLDEFGIDYIEGGWPNPTNPTDIEFFKRIKNENLKHSKIAAFGSTRKPKIKAEDDIILKYLIEADTPVVTIFGKSWDLHVEKVIKTTLEENLEMIYDSVKFLKSKGKEVIYDAEHFFDGYKANPEYALKTLKAAYDAGADTIVLADTNGGTMLFEFRKILKDVKNLIPKDKLGVHVHNDSGLAIANSLLAVEEGVYHIQGVINGFGERCGNANLIPIIANLQIKYKMNVVPEKNLKKLRELSLFVYSVANINPNPRDPYTGDNAFAHKGGAHIDGVLKVSHSFEHINPSIVGNERKYLVSNQSGSATILEKLKKIEPSLTKKDPVIKQILNKVKQLENEGYRFEEAEASFKLIALKELGKYEDYFNIISYRVIEEYLNTNKDNISEAIVKILEDKSTNKIEITAAEGDGPINALDIAMRKGLTKIYPSLKDVRLIDFKVRVLNSQEGTAAKVQVLIESTDGKDFWSTIGVSTNLIEASWLALKDSLMYKLVKDRLGF